ncbi:MAG: PLD nuclease N-terminal domain-containing protein [Dehalococcoidales bacterium]|nr:PLD nuclease N-terminal domain-containing protein [Dehalococcoidales bacterium]
MTYATALLLTIPLILIELGLMVFALYDLVRRKKVKGGNKLLWGILIVLVNLIGPILYLVLGREEESG